MRHDLRETPKILFRSCLLFVQLLSLWGSRVRHEQWAAPPTNQPPDALKSSFWYRNVNPKQHRNRTDEKQYINQRCCRGYIIAQIKSRGAQKMLICPWSLLWPVLLLDLLNRPAESGYSFINVQLPAAVRLPVIVSDRQVTSACPRVALGMRHLCLIKQNKGGLWWYHLGVTAHPPTLSLWHDRRLLFPSNRVSVSPLCVQMKIWWSPNSTKPHPPFSV